MEISSVYSLKTFVNERLTAAAEEIFGVFAKTLSVYEEELVRQRRLLDVVLKPQIKLQRIDLPLPSVYKERLLLDPRQCDQGCSTNVDADDPKPPVIKEEERELCISQEEEHYVLEQEVLALKLSPAYEEHDHSEDQLLHLDPDQTESAAEEEPHPIISHEWTLPESVRKSSEITEQDSDRCQQIKTVEEPYMCTICGKCFKICVELKLHMKVHTGEKPHRCRFCKKEFTSSSSVSRHRRVHTGEKPYECRLCGKRFNVNTTLKVHYRIHTGEKPYKCKSCDKAFTTCSNLKKHMAQHNKAKR